MRVTEVAVRGLGKLQAATWMISAAQKTAILCGDHGTGKSTFLRAINHCLQTHLTLTHPVLPWREVYDYHIRVRLQPTCDADRVLLEGVDSLETPAYATLNGKRERVFGSRVPFCYVSAPYTQPSTASGGRYPLHTSWDLPAQLLWANFAPPGPVTDPLLILVAYLATVEPGARQSALLSLNSALSGIVDLQAVLVDDAMVRCTRRDGSPLDDFDFLSDAEYYALAAVIGTLLCLPSSGVLLLDAPETFLHPKAFESFISQASEHLEHGQLIVATHAPSTLATLTPAEVYVLGQDHLVQTPMPLDRADTLDVVESLYGAQAKERLVAVLSGDSTNEVLAYLLECALSPQAVTRQVGDPQIQQLATWIQGAAASLGGSDRLKVVDVGAGAGDFIACVRASGCAGRLTYVPVEPEMSLWQTISLRGQAVPNLEVQDPRRSVSEVHRANMAVAINVLHELPPDVLASVIRNMLVLTVPHGLVLVHEVTVLPVGEADFIVWLADDLGMILREAGLACDLASATTVTRPGGWPLETTCIRAVPPVPTEEAILSAINRHLRIMLKQWSAKVGSPPPEGMERCSPERYRAFVLAQTANIAHRVFISAAKDDGSKLTN